MSEMIIKNHKIKAIIFDLDGTLLDSCGIWVTIDRDFFRAKNKSLPEDYSSKLAAMGLKKGAIYTKELLGLEESPEEIEKEWLDAVQVLYEEKIILKKGANEFLNKCKESGIPLTVATSNSYECYNPCLERNNIKHYFDHIVDVKKYKNAKNTPDIYLDIAKKLNLKPEEILIFEDTIIPVRVAKAAGFVVCGIKEVAWPVSDDEEKRRIADIYIDDFTELL